MGPAMDSTWSFSRTKWAPLKILSSTRLGHLGLKGSAKVGLYPLISWDLGLYQPTSNWPCANYAEVNAPKRLKGLNSKGWSDLFPSWRTRVSRMISGCLWATCTYMKPINAWKLGMAWGPLWAVAEACPSSCSKGIPIMNSSKKHLEAVRHNPKLNWFHVIPMWMMPFSNYLLHLSTSSHCHFLPSLLQADGDHTFAGFRRKAPPPRYSLRCAPVENHVDAYTVRMWY